MSFSREAPGFSHGACHSCHAGRPDERTRVVHGGRAGCGHAPSHSPILRENVESRSVAPTSAHARRIELELVRRPRPMNHFEYVTPDARERPSTERRSLAPLVSAPEHALAWIRACELPSGGIRMHYGHHRPYPEVTGYWIPTLLSYGERQYAARLAQWLVAVQNADGSFSGHNPADGVYVFDTGQILRGLLATMDMMPEARDAALRAAD